MHSIKCSSNVMWISVTCCIAVISCFPTGKSTMNEPEIKDEKQYPNGTVVGKYSYLDNDGNPIQVKYYADGSSYGVELKSLKIIDPTEEANIAMISKEPLKAPTPHLSTDSFEPLKKQKTDDPRVFKEKTMSRYKADKPNPDFDIYYQNNINEPKNCGGKVRVYYDKERKIRNALDDLEAAKYCEQF